MHVHWARFVPGHGEIWSRFVCPDLVQISLCAVGNIAELRELALYRKVRAASTQWPAPASARRAQARVSLSAAPALGAVEEPPPRIPDAAVGAPTTACPVGPATLRVVRWVVRIQKPRRSWRWRSKSRRSGMLPPPPVPPLLSPGRVPRQRRGSTQVRLPALLSLCGALLTLTGARAVLLQTVRCTHASMQSSRRRLVSSAAMPSGSPKRRR